MCQAAASRRLHKLHPPEAVKFLHVNYCDLSLITTTKAGWKIHFNLGLLKMSKGWKEKVSEVRQDTHLVMW